MNLHHNHRLLIPADREIVTVWIDDDKALYSNTFGVVYDWKPTLQDMHRSRHHAPCVHRAEPLPKTQLFCPDWIAKLRWQPQIITSGPPVIASRIDDVVTLAFNVIGPIVEPGYTCHQNPRMMVQNRCSYRLYRMQWFDEDDPAENILLGVTVPC